ncbi:MAG: metallopeptidase TldD-related protein [candidate division WOR-3 bacterium]
MAEINRTDLAWEILELAGDYGEQAEVFSSESDQTVVEFRANELHTQQVRWTQGFGLRLIKDGRVGFSSTTNPDAIEGLLAAAAETAAYGKAANFSLPGQQPVRVLKMFENRVVLVSAQRLREWGEDLIDAIRSRVPDIKLDLTLRRCLRQVDIINSVGLDASWERTELELSLNGLLVQDGLVWLSDYENLSSGEPLAIGPLAERVCQLARLVRGKAALKTGSYPVLVMPTALPNFLLPLLVAVNGKHLEKGTSPLVGKEENRLLDERLTIADNPLREWSLESAPFDGEGSPCRRNLLFEKGKFKGFLLDLATASACNRATTGSAQRDYASPPTPGTTNIEVSPGNDRLEKVLGEMKEGLIIYDCIGGGQSNLLAGEVTLNISCGLKVVDGVPVGRVKDAMIGGNVYEMFSNIAALGNSQRDLGNYFLPFVLFPGLLVSTKE